jgi:hypothetical protein
MSHDALAKVKQRCQSEDRSRDRRDNQREQDNAWINRDLRRAWDARRIRREQRLQPPVGDGQAEDRPHGRQHHSFRGELTENASATGAKRRTNRKFLVTPLGADEQQVGDVCACYQQYENHRALQDP